MNLVLQKLDRRFSIYLYATEGIVKTILIISLIFLFISSANAGKFLQDFDNGALAGWQELLIQGARPGSWEIHDGELHGISPNGWTRLFTIGDETWRDYSIEFDVKPLKKPGPGNIAIAARIKGDWAVWCVIGDLPFANNISRALCAAGNFRNPSPLFFFGHKLHAPLKLKRWSKLKLDVTGNILNFWINEKHVLQEIKLPNRKTFERLDAGRKKHIEEEHADEDEADHDHPGFQPMPLGKFQDFLAGAAGVGLSN